MLGIAKDTVLPVIRSIRQRFRHIFGISMKVGISSFRNYLDSRSYSGDAAKARTVCSRLRMK